MTHPLHTAACFAPPTLLAAYQALWADVWNDRWRLDCKTINEDVRAVVLGLLVTQTPPAEARAITYSYMRGLRT